MKARLHPVLFMAMALLACGSDRSISDRIAMAEVNHHLTVNPVYETASMEYGEVGFRKNADAEQLDTYQALEKAGYATMELLKERKRFLSKDSTFLYLVKLTDKSIPFVLDKTDKKATVKTVEYTLDEDGGVHVEQNGKNRAKATVTLKKSETDFVGFAKKGSGNNASFIKKTYSLRFNKETGWEVTK